jgi:uncharacterized protein YneF (UPF0154 family)
LIAVVILVVLLLTAGVALGIWWRDRAGF